MQNEDVLLHDLKIFSNNFIKVLEVNLNEGTFYEVKVADNERPQTIYVKDWATEFAKSNIYSDDQQRFADFFDFKRLKDEVSRNKHKTTFYRREFVDGYFYVSMEIVPLDTYTDEDANVILIVREVQSYIDTFRMETAQW